MVIGQGKIAQTPLCSELLVCEQDFEVPDSAAIHFVIGIECICSCAPGRPDVEKMAPFLIRQAGIVDVPQMNRVMRDLLLHQAGDRHGWRDAIVGAAVTGDSDPDLSVPDEVLDWIDRALSMSWKRNAVAPGAIIVEDALDPLRVEGAIGADPRNLAHSD